MKKLLLALLAVALASLSSNSANAFSLADTHCAVAVSLTALGIVTAYECAKTTAKHVALDIDAPVQYADETTEEFEFRRDSHAHTIKNTKPRWLPVIMVAGTSLVAGLILQRGIFNCINALPKILLEKIPQKGWDALSLLSTENIRKRADGSIKLSRRENEWSTYRNTAGHPDEETPGSYSYSTSFTPIHNPPTHGCDFSSTTREPATFEDLMRDSRAERELPPPTTSPPSYSSYYSGQPPPQAPSGYYSGPSYFSAPSPDYSTPPPVSPFVVYDADNNNITQTSNDPSDDLDNDPSDDLD